MKVLSISTDRKIFDESGGVFSRHRNYAEKAEFHVVVFSLSRENLKELNVGNLYLYPTRSYSRWFYVWDAYWLSRRIIKQGRMFSETVISAQDPFQTGFVGVALKIMFKLPLQIQVHTDFLDPNFYKSFLNIVRRVIASFVVPSSDGVRVVSEAVRDSVVKSFPRLKLKVAILPVFVDREMIESVVAKKELAAPSTFFQKNIFMVSRLSKEKRFDIALGALKNVVAKVPEAGLVIFGSGPEGGNIRRLADRMGLAEKVKYMGWQDSETVWQYFSSDSSAVFLLTSEYEGYGMVLVEAGVCGLPIVTTRVGLAKTDLFQNSLNSHVCDVGDVSCLTNSVVQLLESGELRKNFNQKMRESLSRVLLSKQEYTAKYTELLQNTLTSNIKKTTLGLSWHWVVEFFESNLILRYLLVGGSAGISDLIVLHILYNIFGIYYLLSAILAFIVAFLVSFIFHKFWTFKSHEEKTHSQLLLYFGNAMFSLVMNTALLYVFVDYFHMPVILSQMIVGLMVACFTFFISRNIVFKYKPQ